MDLLNELLDLLGLLVSKAIEGLSKFLQWAVGAASEFTEAQMQLCASLLLVGVVTAWFVRKANWGKMKMLAPQTVTLRTEKTPIQVVMEDLGGCVVSLLILVVLAAILYALLMGR